MRGIRFRPFLYHYKTTVPSCTTSRRRERAAARPRTTPATPKLSAGRWHSNVPIHSPSTAFLRRTLRRDNKCPTMRPRSFEQLPQMCSETRQEVLFQLAHGAEVEYCNELHTWHVLRCLGCETVGFRYRFDDYDDVEELPSGKTKHATTYHRYPNAIPGHRLPDHLYVVPDLIREVYRQSVTAYAGGALDSGRHWSSGDHRGRLQPSGDFGHFTGEENRCAVQERSHLQ